MKTLKKNNGVFYVVISLLGVLAIGTGIFAYSNSQTVTVNGGTYNYNEATVSPTDVAPTDQTLGAVSGPDYYWDYFNFNGLTTYVKTVGFADATTSLACIKNPLGATSTVDLAEVLITGPSTTTFTLYVGTSTVATGNTTTTIPAITSAASIIPGVSITLNTIGVAINNVNLGYSGTYAAGAVARMPVGANEYVCFVAADGATGSTAGVINGGNTFAGIGKLRFNR